DRDRLELLLDRLGAFAPLSFTASFRADSLCGPDPGSVDLELIAALRRAGLKLAFIGVESLSASQLQRYGKRQEPLVAVAVVKALEAHGVEVEIGNIPFDPMATISELRESTELLYRSGLYRNLATPFGVLRLQLGTPLARMAAISRRPEADDPELLSYGWRFADKEVGDLFAMVDEWWSPLDRAYLLARNLVRTGVLGELQSRIAMRNLALVRAHAVGLLRTGVLHGSSGVEVESYRRSAGLLVLSCLRGVAEAAVQAQVPEAEAVQEYLAELESLVGKGSVVHGASSWLSEVVPT
ncbi:MAG: hypothetical protein LWW77_01900, partial [Propionibacteriales bacterium]|nr:hypothetical protein [Propionibacteriales bacterium]